VSLGRSIEPDTLADFRFGFNHGEEIYQPEDDGRYESVRWSSDNETLLLLRMGAQYVLLYSDQVKDRDYEIADVCRRSGKLAFDPLLFKVIGLQFVEGIPAEVT